MDILYGSKDCVTVVNPTGVKSFVTRSPAVAKIADPAVASIPIPTGRSLRPEKNRGEVF